MTAHLHEMKGQEMRYRWLAACAAATTVCAAAPAAPAAAGTSTTLTPIPGSPFTTLGSPSGDGDGADGLAYSGDGSLLTTADGDGSISEFSAQSSGALTPRAGAYLGEHDPAYRAAWNPAGTVLAVGYSPGPEMGAIAIYSRRHGSLKLTLKHTLFGVSGDFQFAFSPDGRYFAATLALTGAPHSQGGFEVWSVRSGGGLSSVASKTLDNAPEGIAFSPNSADLAVGDVAAHKVNVFSVGSFTPIKGSPFSVGFASTTLAYAPHGTLLASANDNSSSVSLANVSRRGTLSRGHPARAGGPVQALAWNPSGTLLAASTGAGTDAVYGIHSGKLSPINGSPFSIAQTVGQLQFSPNGKDLATAATNDTSGPTSSEVSVLAVSTTGGATSR